MFIWNKDKEIKIQDKIRMKKRKRDMADKEKVTKEKETQIEIRFLCTVNNFCFFERPMCIAGHL